MKKIRILTKTTSLSNINFDDLYNEISSDWRLKAERLQSRRWRQLKRAMTSEGEFRGRHTRTVDKFNPLRSRTTS